MKRILLIITLIIAGAAAAKAQDTTRTAPVDTTLAGRSILSVLGPGITLNQSTTVRQSLENYVSDNAERKINGYRVRVFYDNAPTARARSESIVKQLKQQFPGVEVYLSFESPNYKVAIGDFRSKDEALAIYNALKYSFPTAYIIKESINYPR